MSFLQLRSADSSQPPSDRGDDGAEGTSAALALQLNLPHEVRLKLAKTMRGEQLRRYHEREKQLGPATSEHGPSVDVERGGTAARSSGYEQRRTRVSFGAKELLLDAARKSDSEEVYRIVSGNLASPDTSSKASGSSLLHLCSLNDDLPSVQLLLELGANVNIQDYDLWTPLHIAAACGHMTIAETLLEYDADCTLLDVDGNFAYDSAESADLKELLLRHMSFKGIYEQDLKSLRSRKAKAMLAAVKDCVNRNRNLNFLNKNGVALLHITAANAYYTIAKLLLDGGADVDVLDDLDYTPLHVAAKFNQLKMVKMLLKRGANPSLVSSQLEQPIDLADSDEISKLLEQAGEERRAVESTEDVSLGGAFPLPPASPSPATVVVPPPSPTAGNDSGVETNDPPLTPSQIQSININFDEFDLARATSKILNRSNQISRLEVLFEAETLAERDKFDEGTDDSAQAPALRRLHGKIQRRRTCQKLHLPDPAATDNLATLSDLTEDILVQFLGERYQRDQIYTLVGEILVALNPFKHLPIYSDLASQRYSDVTINSTLPPHIFAVADQVYNDMLADRKPQSCVISGESGAGKTETSKLLIQHFLYVASSDERELSIKIEQVSPVLEAFGNAKTSMNNNSSRFGKYLELLFSRDGAILGGCFKEYLLEKCRVTVQGASERNFHIFYQMFAGLSDEQKEMLCLDKPTNHRCLAGSGETLDDVITPAVGKSFVEVCDSLQAIGFSQQDQQSILYCLASVLHICDVRFASEDEGSAVSNPDKVDIVAKLLQVDPRELAACLIQEAVVTRGEEIVRRRSVVLANDCRDALAKALYGRMFGWIVNGINHHLQPEDLEPTHPLRIGILDIFGFENFKKNSFEQMCINIANEQLQHFFNEHIFKWEQDECAQEGVAIETIHFQSNWPVVDLFLAKTSGVLALVDEESRFPRATDHSLAAKMHKVHHKGRGGGGSADKVDRVYRAPPDKGAKFGVNHYAGYVEYDVTGFLDKNRDTLPPSILMLMKTSGNLLVREMFGAKLTRTGSIAPSMRQKMSRKAVSPFSHFNRKTSKRLSRATMARKNAQRSPVHGRKFDTGRRAPCTVSNHFRSSLTELMEKMKASRPRFIRCIKPNTEKMRDSFVSHYVQKQLRYTGVMETARIRQHGFPTRLTFHDFCKRYWILKEMYVPQLSLDDALPSKDTACRILERVGVSGWVCGRTKVMLKFNHIAELDKHTGYVYTKTVTIQRCFRDWQTRNMMHELVKVKQKQAELINHLLGTVIEQGQSYLAKLERLNYEDSRRTTERSRHTPPQLHSDRSHPHHHHHSDSQRETMYAKVTSAHNLNNNANTSSSSTESYSRQTTSVEPPVCRIRSLPRCEGEGDDTIMIASPNGSPSLQLDVDHRANAMNVLNRESRGNHLSYSRQHAPLPPVPDNESDAVYSLAEPLPPPRPQVVATPPSSHYSSRQNAPLPPPPTSLSATNAETESVSRLNEPSRSERDERYEMSSNTCRSFHNDIYDETQYPPDNSQRGTSLPAGSSPISRITTPQGPSERRRQSPLPPIPSSSGGPLGTNKQLSESTQPTAIVNKANSQHHMMGSQQPHAGTEPSKLSANQIAQRSRSPSPFAASPRNSPGKGSSIPPPSPPLPYSQSRDLSRRRSQSSSNIKVSHRQSASLSNGEEAPPPPPPRKTSAPIDSSLASTHKKSLESDPSLPSVAHHKTSSGRSNVDQVEAPPLPSRKICDNHESNTILSSADCDEPVAPPLPSRNIIQDKPVEPQGTQQVKRNAHARTPSSDSLTSLPERQEASSCSSSGVSEGIFSRFAMQRRLKGLLGAPINRNRASSNEFGTSSCAKKKLGKRLSDPSRVASSKNQVPIHKTPLPPIPVQMPTSVSSPELLDIPQDVYEDPDKTLKSMEEDEPQLHYEDIDMDADRPHDHYEDIDVDSDEAQEFYEDIDMDNDRPQDHYEDIDHDAQDRPQEVYEDINNEAAQRVSFKMSGAQDYTPPISRRGVAGNDWEEPEDYTPPISRRSKVYSEDDEPQDYTPPIRRGRAAYPEELEEGEEPQDYTVPIRRSRMFDEEDTPPIRKSVVQDGPSMPSPPLPPRSTSRQPCNRRRRAAATAPSAPAHRPTSSLCQPNSEKHQTSSLGQIPSTNPHVNSTSRSHPVAATQSPAHSKPPVPSRSLIPPAATSPSHPRSFAPPGSRRSPAPPKSPGNPSRSPVPSPTRSRPQIAASPHSHSNHEAPPTGGAPPPPPPPPPSTGFRAPPSSSDSHSADTAVSSGEDDSDPPAAGSLLDGIRKVQLKRTSGSNPPRKPPPSATASESSRSVGTTTNLFTEMQALQLKKTNRPNSVAVPSPVDESTPAVPDRSALRPTQSGTRPPPPPISGRPVPRARTKSPAAKPRSSKPPPPSIKPKPAFLVSPQPNARTSPRSPRTNASQSHVSHMTH